MNDALKALEALLQGSAATSQLYPPTSRYYGIPIATFATPDGRTVAYLTRRLIPQSNQAALSTHVVAQGDRLDNLSARYLGDPEQYWRICDANEAIRPSELTETPGRELRITMPDGTFEGSGGD